MNRAGRLTDAQRNRINKINREYRLREDSLSSGVSEYRKIGVERAQRVMEVVTSESTKSEPVDDELSAILTLAAEIREARKALLEAA